MSGRIVCTLFLDCNTSYTVRALNCHRYLSFSSVLTVAAACYFICTASQHKRTQSYWAITGLLSSAVYYSSEIIACDFGWMIRPECGVGLQHKLHPKKVAGILALLFQKPQFSCWSSLGQHSEQHEQEMRLPPHSAEIFWRLGCCCWVIQKMGSKSPVNAVPARRKSSKAASRDHSMGTAPIKSTLYCSHKTRNLVN